MNAPTMKAQPGAGTRVTQLDGIGFAVSASRGGARFGHPWKPLLGVLSLQFSLGLVTGNVVLVPKIKVGGSLVSMGADPAPRLALDPEKRNEKTGTSFAVLEVVPGADGKLTKDSRVEIVHSGDDAASTDPLLGRKPIAIILWRDRQPFRVFPLVHFHLEYQRVLPPAGGGVVRHYFL